MKDRFVSLVKNFEGFVQTIFVKTFSSIILINKRDKFVVHNWERFDLTLTLICLFIFL